MMFGDYGIGVLRGFLRAMCPETRGAGALGNIGHKEEIIDYLTTRGYDVDDCSAWMRENNKREEVTAAEDQQQQQATATEKTGNDAIFAALDALRAAITAKDQRPKEEPPKIDLEEVRKVATEAAATEYAKHFPPVVVEVRREDGSAAKFDKVHCEVPNLIKIVGAGLHVLLTGPAGSGKTTACKQIAEALGLSFYPMSVGPQTTKSDLLGFRDATGSYHATPLREAFEHGGLLLLDEIDAGNPGVITTINMLLENGVCAFPDGIISRHENFRCIAAANTYGRGADRLYVGRNQLDAATLNRFVSRDFDYDEALEMLLAGNDDWCAYVQSLRHAAESLKERVIISPRASLQGAKLLKLGFSRTEVASMTIWKGVGAEIREKIIATASDEYQEWKRSHKVATEAAD